MIKEIVECEKSIEQRNKYKSGKIANYELKKRSVSGKTISDRKNRHYRAVR